MDSELIRVFFCSPDIAFAEPLTHALGAGFQIRATRELRWPGAGDSGFTMCCCSICRQAIKIR